MAVNIFPAPSAGNPTYAFTFTGPKLFQPTVPAGIYEVKTDLPAGGLISSVSTGQDIFAGTPVARASGSGAAVGLVNLTGSNSLMVQDTSPSTFNDPRFVLYFNVFDFDVQRIKGVNGRFVAVGTNGRTANSTDGITWTLSATPTTETLRDVIWDGTRFIVVGGSAVLTTSTNLISWTTPFGVSNGWGSPAITMAFNNGNYVIGFDRQSQTNPPTFVRSANFVNWSNASNNLILRIFHIISYNNLFVAVGTGFGFENVATSTDGVTWANRSLTNSGHSAIAVGQGRVWTLSEGDTTGTSSTDGITWVTQGSTPAGARSMVFSNNEFVAFFAGSVSVSTNFVTWVGRSHGLNSDANRQNGAGLNGITLTGFNSNITRSSNNFAGISNGGQNVLGSVFGAGRFVFVGANGSIVTSTDTATWTTRTSGFGTTQINAIAFGNGLYVAAGNAGVLTTSTDTITWTTRTSQFGTSNIQAVTFGNGLFLAGGAGGVLTTSVNGVDWTARTSGTTGTIFAVAAGNRSYIAGGAAGVFRYSTDGITWTTRTTTFGTTEIRCATFGNGLFVIGGAAGTLATSPDGVSWTARVSGFPATATVNGVTFANGIFIAAGTSAISTSTDGVTWIYDERPRQIIAGGNLNTASAGAGKYATAGDSGLAAIADINPNFGGARSVVLEFKGAAVAG
jgi:hypothetical protein